MTEPEIVWQDPPAVSAEGRRGRQVDPRITAMKASPGRWMLWQQGASNGAGGYLKNRHGLEVTTRNNKGGKCDLYARWNG